MSDAQPTVPLPDSGARWVLSTDAPATAPRRRRWPWLVAVLAVLALAVGAWFAGEYIARGIVERTIREQVSSRLDLPADQQIDVDVAGPVLPQLIVGSLSEVKISAADVSLRGLSAAVTVTAQDVPLRGGDWSGGVAEVTLDQTQLQTLLAQLDGFPVQTVSIDAPNVDADFELMLFALSVPVGVSLTPSAVGGDIVLTPEALRVAGAEVSADALQRQFGAVASTVLRDWEVCIADRLPRAVELTGIEVRRERLIADFEIDSAILTDPAAQQSGTCA